MACWKGGGRDDAARGKQEGTTEVAEVDFRAGAERADGGGVLPGARGICAPQFFAWKKRLSEAGAAKFVEVKLKELCE